MGHNRGDHRQRKWALDQAKLSAHWGALTNSTGTHEYTDFYFPTIQRGRPLVWVAEDKHANYNGSNACDRGADWTDNCDQNTWSTSGAFYSFNVLPGANLGRSGDPMIISATSRGSSIGGGTGGVWTDLPEWFWAAGELYRFHGWQLPNGIYATANSYGDPLLAHGF